MVNISEMSDKDLIERFKSLWFAIHIAECYSNDEVIELMRVEEELDSRGYMIVDQVPKVVKMERC